MAVGALLWCFVRISAAQVLVWRFDEAHFVHGLHVAPPAPPLAAQGG